MFYTVPQAHCVVIERFGKFSRIQREGLRIRLPMVEKIRRVDDWGSMCNKRGFMIELSEQQTDTPTRQCHTRDNVSVNANASVYWRIIDARKAVYEIDMLPKAVSDIALNALRSNIGNMDLDEVLSERQRLNDRIAAELAETATKWGVQITRCEIQELQTSDDTAKAMAQQMDAERGRRARVAEAEGQAEAELKLAESAREAAVMRAEGQAKALERMAEAETHYIAQLSRNLPPEQVAKVLIAQKYLQGFDTITRNPASKVFLPNSFPGIFDVSVDGKTSTQPGAEVFGEMAGSGDGGAA
jgi:regulator of protease activity HflC (stomatin/prohibitin superfamily)